MFSSSDTEEDEEATNEDEDAGNKIEVKTVVPYRDSDSESELEQLSSVSGFDLLSGSDEEESTASDTIAFSYVRGRGRGRGHAVAWYGRIVDSCSESDDDTLPYNWASGRGAVANEQRRQSPGRQTCQAGSRPRMQRNRWVILAGGRTLVVKVQNLKIYY